MKETAETADKENLNHRKCRRFGFDSIVESRRWMTDAKVY